MLFFTMDKRARKMPQTCLLVHPIESYGLIIVRVYFCADKSYVFVRPENQNLIKDVISGKRKTYLKIEINKLTLLSLSGFRARPIMMVNTVSKKKRRCVCYLLATLTYIFYV